MNEAAATSAQAGILPHHQVAASLWSLGGENYDEISFGVSDALAHAAQRLAPKADEQILDVATGTGWSARNVARAGARVTAVDIAADLLTAARELSAHVRPPIAFQLADAESLPLADGRFDGVISTFGVMFAWNHEKAAAELARVCRKGGRLVLATWTREGAVAKFFSIVGKHSGAPPPPVSPLGRSRLCEIAAGPRFRPHVRARREQCVLPGHTDGVGRLHDRLRTGPRSCAIPRSTEAGGSQTRPRCFPHSLRHRGRIAPEARVPGDHRTASLADVRGVTFKLTQHPAIWTNASGKLTVF